jgi:hypothetical protein
LALPHRPNSGRHEAIRCRTGKTLPYPFASTPYVFSSCYMASVLKILLDFLRRLRFPTDYTKRFSGHWALFFAFICRRFGLWRLWHKKPRTFRKTSPANPPFPSVGARGYSVLGSSADFREHILAASAVPKSPSLSSLHERVPRQTRTASPSGAITLPALVTSSLTADGASSPYDGNRVGNRSSANLSTNSRASDRRSLLTQQSRESLRTPARQPSPLPRATSRQFGLGPRLSRSRERPSRSPSPTNRFPLHSRPPHLEVDTTNIQTPAVVVNPATSPTVPPFYTHEPLSPPIDHRSNRRQSTGSVALGVVGPSTDSLPLTSWSPPPLTSESFPIGSPTAHSSPVSVPADILDAPLSPTTSSVISDFYLPEGRFIALIHSDQVPRYSKDIKMQVDYTVLLLHS